MVRGDEVLANILAGADEVADSLFLRGRDADGGELASAVEPSKLGSVAPVKLMRSPGFRGMSAGAMTSQAMLI